MRISTLATALVLVASTALAGPPVQTEIDPADLFPIVPRGNPSAQSHYIKPQTMAQYFLSQPGARTDLGVGIPVSINDKGARADALTFGDAVMAAGSTTLTSASATFTAADIGKKIQVDGAAGVWLPPLRTTITGFGDAHTVTLGAAATEATPRRWLAAVPTVITPRAAGNYVPGDILTITGGTYTTQAVVKVISTMVTATTIVGAGTGGVDGSCRIQGTTGTGTLIQEDVTIAGGAITVLGAFPIGNGHYFTKPTNLAVEPVTNAPGYNCVPSGATLALTMGVDLVVVQTRGDYDPTLIPADPIASGAGSISGATGATFATGGANGTFSPTGTFIYGTDDSQALKDSIDAAAAFFASGKTAYVYMPSGNYLIDSIVTPLMHSGLGVIGEGTGKTNIIIGANYNGDLLSWSDAWGAQVAAFNGNMYQVSSNRAGPKAIGFTVAGNRTSGFQQNGLMFYDRNDSVMVDDVSVNYVTGRCMQSGMTKEQTNAFMRESYIGKFGCNTAGSPGVPGVEFSSEGTGDATDEISIDNMNIYATFGDGLVFKNNTATDRLRTFRINKLRIEGLQWADNGADLLRIGDAGSSGPIFGIYINQLELLTPYPGKAAFRVTGPGDIYFIDVAQGTIASGLPMGYGLYLEAGRQMRFHFSDIYTWNTNVVEAAGITGYFSLDGDGAEQNWTYNLINPLLMFSPLHKVAGQIVQADLADGTITGGNPRGTNTVDMQTKRFSPIQVAGGASSVVSGGEGNLATGLQTVVAGGLTNQSIGHLSTVSGGVDNVASGYATSIPGGAFSNDHSAFGGMYYSPGGCQIFQASGSCQRSWHVLGAGPGTDSAVRLTSDGAVPGAGGLNCIPIPDGEAYHVVVRVVARNWTSHDSSSWNTIEGMLARKPGFSMSWLGGGGGAPDASTGAALGTIAVAADDTNKCLDITYTPPALNADLIHVVATVDAAEVQ